MLKLIKILFKRKQIEQSFVYDVTFWEQNVKLKLEKKNIKNYL